MKNRALMIVIPVIVIIIICSILYYNKKENERIDREAVTFVDDLTIEFGKEVKVSDFISNLNGQLVSDFKIDTEHLGDIDVAFDFINIKNKKRTRNFTIKVVDLDNPKIFGKDSYTLVVGSDKDIKNLLLSGDDIDDNPKRKVIGYYDLNTVGDYNLTYEITDSSDNKATKDFVLHVIEKKDPEEDDNDEEEKKIFFEDVIEKYKNDNTKIGIDVSKWQQEIDWETVKNAGVEFAIIRVGTQSGYDGEYKLDQYFERNVEEALANDIPVGVYFFSYAKNVNQAKDQARWVRDQISKYDITLPVTFDWENWTSFNTTGMSFRTINKVADAFLDYMNDNGYIGMLYGSKTYLNNIWYSSRYDTWLAHYTEETDYDKPFRMWQLCENGRIDGIEEDIDIDVMYLNNKGGF